MVINDHERYQRGLSHCEINSMGGDLFMVRLRGSERQEIRGLVSVSCS